MPPKKKKDKRPQAVPVPATQPSAEAEKETVLTATADDDWTGLSSAELTARIARASSSLSDAKSELKMVVSAAPLRVPLPISLERLLQQWAVYAPLLTESIGRFRDFKLLKYADLTHEAAQEVRGSYSRTRIWRSVFEQRYGLSGDPSDSAAAFLDHGIERLVPEDLENIKRYIRLRSLFLVLYTDAVRRQSPVLKDPRVLRLQPDQEASSEDSGESDKEGPEGSEPDETEEEEEEDEDDGPEPEPEPQTGRPGRGGPRRGRNNRARRGGGGGRGLAGLPDLPIQRLTPMPLTPMAPTPMPLTPMAPTPMPLTPMAPTPMALTPTALTPMPLTPTALTPMARWAVWRPVWRAVARPRWVGLAGGSARVGGLTERECNDRTARDMRVFARGTEQKYLAYTADEKGRFAKFVNGGACWRRQDDKDMADCYKVQSEMLTADYNALLDEKEDADKALKSLKDRRWALSGRQAWMRAKWHIVPLRAAEAQVESLHALLHDLVRGPDPVIGRSEVLNMVAGMVHTFAYNHLAFSKSFLNWTMLGPPGAGKTRLAQIMGSIFRYLGILLTDKFSVITREDLVAEYLGQTATKTKGVLVDNLEGVLFLDEAYQLGTDEYGRESATTIVNFLDKHQSSIVMFAAGYDADMEVGFYGANAGLERRFKRLYLSPFTATQLAAMLFTRIHQRLTSPDDRKAWASKDVWAYVDKAFQTLNAGCVDPTKGYCYLSKGGGDIENLTDDAMQYYNSIVRPEKRRVTVCDMVNILRQYMFSSQRANVLIYPPECAPSADEAQCNSGPNHVCMPLVRPNEQLFSYTPLPQSPPRSPFDRKPAFARKLLK